MNLGASMLAHRVHQRENEDANFWKGMLIGVPVAVAIWTVIIWIAAAVFG